MTEIIYTIDSSSIINLAMYQPRDIFKGLWRKLEELATTERLFIHVQVIAELDKKDYAALEWVKSLLANCRVDIDNDQGEFIERLTREHRHLKHRLQDPRYAQSADPFIVATGFTRSYWVITDERPSGDWKLPDLCRKYGIPYVDCYDLMRQEEWEF